MAVVTATLFFLGENSSGKDSHEKTRQQKRQDKKSSASRVPFHIPSVENGTAPFIYPQSDFY